VIATPQQTDDEGKQSKRILGIFPNYRAVSVGTQLPPLSIRKKFWLATQDSFDYSSFISAGLLAGVSQANKSYPEFGQGAKGFGRYYWHAVADQAVGNYMTEAIVPSLTREDLTFQKSSATAPVQEFRTCIIPRESAPGRKPAKSGSPKSG
jgi:hypothetical protein